MNLVFPLLLAFTVGFITSNFDCCSISVYCLLVCVCLCVSVFLSVRYCCFLANVNSRSRRYLLSPVRLSVVCRL